MSEDKSPVIAQYFQRLSAGALLRCRHPYDFRETYDVLRRLYGYRLHYVNLGYWNEGGATAEAGRVLTFALAKGLDLKPGARIADVGAGLGQAAVDLMRHYDLARADCYNINAAQTRFAEALSTAEGLSGGIAHHCEDAAEGLGRLQPRTLDAVIAVECAGHFPDAGKFLSNVHHALSAGGRIGLCLNVARSRLGLVQAAAYRAAFGCVPAPLAVWTEGLSVAGFHGIRVEDWSEPVLGRGLAICLDRLRRGDPGLSPLLSAYLKFQLSVALHSVRKGRLGYYAVWATA